MGFVTFGAYAWEHNAQVLVDPVNASLARDNSPLTTMNNNDTSFVSMERASGLHSGVSLNNDVEISSTIDVIATSPPSLGNETFQAIAFSFVGDAAHLAPVIYWDPTTGVYYEAIEDDASSQSGGASGSVSGGESSGSSVDTSGSGGSANGGVESSGSSIDSLVSLLVGGFIGILFI